MLHYLGWAFLQPLIVADIDGPVAMMYWASQAGSSILCFLTCILGFLPAIHISRVPGEVTIRQGSRICRINEEDLLELSTTSALIFHRHYQRYAATQSFVNRIEQTLLLLRTPHGLVVLGLPAEDRKALTDALQTGPPTYALNPTVNMA